MTSLVLLERVPPLALLTLNRADRHNSLVPELLQGLLAGLQDSATDQAVRAVVLQAAGRSFSTGGDLGGFAAHQDDLPAYAGEIVGLLNQTMLAMLALPVPIVAAVQGQVTGGSLGLVLAADVVLVSPEASFTPYYSEVGFSPDGGWTAWLPAVIGPGRAAEILLDNRTISARQAVAWGLASRLVPQENLHQAARDLAAGLSERHAGSLRRIKNLLRPTDLAARLEDERAQFVAQIGTPETRARMLAFMASMRT